MTSEGEQESPGRGRRGSPGTQDSRCHCFAVGEHALVEVRGGESLWPELGALWGVGRLGTDVGRAGDRQVKCALGMRGEFMDKEERGQSSWNLPSKGRNHSATSEDPGMGKRPKESPVCLRGPGKSTCQGIRGGVHPLPSSHRSFT